MADTAQQIDGGGEQGSDAAQAAGQEWYGALSDEVRTQHESLKDTPLPDVLTGYRALETRLESAIEVPGENATQEEKEAFAAKLRAALKVPETADAYKEILPSGLPADDPIVAGVLAAAHQTAMTTEQVKAMVDTFLVESEKQREVAKQTAIKQLEKEWGKDFVPRLEAAHKGLRNAALEAGISPEDLEATIDSTGWGNNPVLVKMFAQIGRFYEQDSLAGPGAKFAPAVQYTDSGQPLLNYEPGFVKR